MTALKASEVARFLSQPDLEAGVLLIYGPDTGLVREAARRLSLHYSGNQAGTMGLVTLDGSELDVDPGRLLVEARTPSLFGDRRVVRIRGAGKSIVAPLGALLEDPAGAVVIIEAANLTPRDPLRAVIEASARGRTLPCYPDTDDQLARLIEDWLAGANLRAEAGVVQMLLETLGNDREITRRELEKLAFYAADTGVLGVADVVALCADNAALAIDDVLDAVATGHAARLEKALQRTAAAAVSDQQVLAMALAHFTRLRQWRAEVDTGLAARHVLNAARPKPHFSRIETLERQLRMWSDPALAAALLRLHQAARESRRRYRIAETLVARALLAVATIATQV